MVTKTLHDVCLAERLRKSEIWTGRRAGAKKPLRQKPGSFQAVARGVVQ
jgi:hypothetical protein